MATIGIECTLHGPLELELHQINVFMRESEASWIGYLCTKGVLAEHYEKRIIKPKTADFLIASGVQYVKVVERFSNGLQPVSQEEFSTLADELVAQFKDDEVFDRALETELR